MINLKLIFEQLCDQHQVLVFERDRLRALKERRGLPANVQADISLTAKIEAITDALKGLAKLLELCA